MPRSETLVLAVVAAMASLGGFFGVRTRGADEKGAGHGEPAEKSEVRGAAAACETGVWRALVEYAGVGEPGSVQGRDDLERVVREYVEAPDRTSRAPRFRTVLVTIADPIDSRLDSAFDETLAALHLAATNLGYALDRFWLPWQLDRRQLAAGSSPDPCRTRQPGVILYRPPPDRLARRDPPLAFLLVGETPTTGIQAGALASALKVADLVGEPGRNLTVLGPSFSGSAASLGRELRSRGQWTFRVVTGSATADIEKLMNDVPVEFAGGGASEPKLVPRSTVHKDLDMWETVVDYLWCHLDLDPGHVALLIESGSAYASGFRVVATSDEQASAAATSEEPADASALEDARRRYCRYDGARPVPDYRPRTVLRFPMQIARVRQEYDRDRVQDRVTVAGHAVLPEAIALRAEAHRAAKDVLPELSRTATNYDELELAAELGMLRRHGIRAVGIVATDPLDKIFLVGKLREYVPDVLVFTFESNVLFVHPDVQDAMYGALVVSTYPLLVDAEAWTVTGPRRGRTEFASSAAEGIYNAAVLALERTPEPASRPHQTHLLDYGCPYWEPRGEAGAPPRVRDEHLRPPVWISVVGRDALWPIWLAGCGASGVASEDCAHGGVTCGVRLDTTSSLLPRVRPPRASRALLLLSLVLSLLAAASTLPVLAARGLLGRGLLLHRSPFALAAGRERSHAAWSMAHLAVNAVVVACLSLVLHTPRAANLAASAPVTGPDWELVTAVVAALVAGWLLGSLAVPARELLRSPRRRADGSGPGGAAPPPLPSVGARLALLGFAAALAAAMAGASPGIARWALGCLDRQRVLLLVERMSDPGNGVSPMMPLLFLALAVQLAALHQLVRGRLLCGCGVNAAEHGRLLTPFTAAADPILSGLDERLARLVRGPPGIRAIGSAAAFVSIPLAILLCAWPRFHTPDGPGFAKLFAGLLALAIVIVGSSLQRTWSTWRTLRLALERLPRDPVGAALARMPALFGPERLKRLFWRGPQVQDLEACLQAFRRAFPRQRVREQDDIDALLRSDPCPTVPCWSHEALGALGQAAAASSRDGRPAAGAGEEAAWLDAAREDFAASQLALAILWILAHLRWRLAASVMGAVSILLALAFYPVQPMHLLLLLVWIVVLGAAGSAVVVYAQHGRDEVLSWLGGTTPGKLSFDASHLARFIGLGGAPVVALLALAFPGLARWIGTWLTPLFDAMK